MVDFVLFIGIKEKVILLQFEMGFLFMSNQGVVAAVIRIDLVGVRIVGNAVKFWIDYFAWIWVEDAAADRLMWFEDSHLKRFLFTDVAFSLWFICFGRFKGKSAYK